MKQEKTQKSKKWILPVVIVAVVVLAIVGVVLAMFMKPESQNEGPEQIQSKLYWNVDKHLYTDPESGMSTRTKGSDGLFTIRFAVDGEVVEYKAADKKLVNSIDFMNVVGLVFDADGMIIEAVDPKTVATEVAKEFFVKSIADDKLVVNSSIAMNGMEMVIPLTSATGIYNVDPAVQGAGQKDVCQLMDKVTIYAELEDKNATTHVFIQERAKGDGVYYRVDQFYDKTKGSTTREPDENGVYTIPFAYEGQIMNLKCKDKDLVSKIDALNDPKHHLGLIFDEEGYIIDFVTAAVALRGQMAYRLMTVTAVGGNIATIEDIIGEGADGVVDLNIDKDCDIFLVEDGCVADFIGQRMDGLQVNDVVTVYTDLEDKPILIYITRRTVESEMYYNVSRKYSKTTLETTRVPDEDGWYVFDMITVNKQVQLRTKDKAIATAIDKPTGKVMGLKLSGTTILDVYNAYCLSGHSHVGEGRYVTEFLGQIIRIVSSSNFESGGNYLTSADATILDVTGDYSAKVGAKINLRVGDQVTGYTNTKKEITHCVVTSRYYEGTKLYYNTARAYDSTTKETTRAADADGYYVFDMICEGKEVQVKTKDKGMASFIDADTYQFRALKVSKDGIITEAYKDVSAMKFSVKQTSNVFYDSTNSDGTINYYYMSSGERVEKTTSFTINESTKIYNYSTSAKTVGEKTTLKKGDLIQGYGSYETKNMLVIFVKERKVESKLYWHVSRQYSTTTLQTLRQPNSDGYYEISVISEDGEILNLKTKSKKVATTADSFATAFGLTIEGDVIVAAHNFTSVKGVLASAAGYYDAMKITDSKISFTRNRPASSSTGNVSEYKRAKDHKVVNVTSYSDKYGQKDVITVGDRTTSYVNDKNELICTFIVNDNTHKKGAISHCDHCNKDVWWEHFTGTVYKADCHYYITRDHDSSNKTVGYTDLQLALDPNLEEYELVFDLNGYSWNTTNYKIALGDKTTILDTVGGGRLQVGGTGILNVKNTTVDFTIDVPGESAKIQLEGTVKTSGDGAFKLAAGAKLDISQLSADSKIVVSGRDVFTTERDDIEKYLSVFVPASENGRIEVVGKALTYIQEKVVYTTEQIIEMTHSAEYLAKFANGGTVTAMCPVCGLEEDWTPIGAGSADAPKSSQTKIVGHVYYDQDTWTTSVNILTGETTTGCVFLNGKTVTGIGRIRANKAINIMGPGKIVKNANDASENDNNALFVLDSSNTKLNFYGGEYINNIASQPLFQMTASTSGGTGTIYAGTFESAGTALEMNHGSAKFNILSGSVKGGAAKLDAGKLTIGDATVACDMVAAMPFNIILTGKPDMTGTLDLSSGALVTLDDLDTAASVLVKANGGFTQPTDKADDYVTAQTFQVPAGYQAVINDGGMLWTAPEGYVPPESSTPEWSENTAERIDQWTQFYAGDFETAEEAGEDVFTEICPICGARNVTWDAKNGTYTSLAPGNSATHYYLSEDYGRVTQQMIGTSQSAPLCLYLNNKTYSTIGIFRISGNVVNIFDDNNTEGGGITRVLNTYATAADPDKESYLPLPLFDVYANSVLNIYGGEFKNMQTIVGTYNPDGTTLLNIRATGSANIYGGTFTHEGEGKMFNVLGELKLAGAPTIGAPGIVLADDVVMNIDELAANASVAIAGTNGKVITAASDNAAAVKDAFTVIGDTGLYLDINAGNQLYITDGTTPDPEPGPGTDPEQPGSDNATVQAIDQWLDTYAADFTAASAAASGANVTTATCPICGAQNVTWSPRSANNNLAPVDGNATHFYLYSDVVRNTFDACGSSQDAPVCVYLNNKTYSTTGSFQVKNTLNIFDDPDVAGGKVLGADGTEKGSTYVSMPLFRLTKDTNNAAPALNIYYGEYESAQPHVEGINDSGTALIAAQVDEVQAYIYGATLINTGYGEALRVNAGNVVLENCALNGGSGYVGSDSVSYGGNIYIGGGDLTLKNVTVSAGTATNGSVYFAGGALTLSGKTDIAAPGLIVGADLKVSLTELDTASRIHVKAQGIFTEATDKAADYVTAGTFTVPTGYQAVAALQDLLWTGVEGTATPEYPGSGEGGGEPDVPLTPEQQIKANVDAWLLANKDAFAAGGNVTTDTCPICGAENVTWTAKSSGRWTSGSHLYLTASYSASSFDQIGSNHSSARCVYLNNYTYTSEGTFSVKNTLNIFDDPNTPGGGIVDANSVNTNAQYEKQPMFKLNGSAPVLNIYYGTYETQQAHLAGANDNGTALIGSEVAAAQTYIYGATLNNTGYGEVLRAGNGTVVLENCTLNGSSGYVSDEGVTYGGSIYMNGGTVTLKGVTVAGGTAANGSVYVADGALTLSGDTTIAAPGLDLTSGAKVTLENLGANASVVVKANGAFTVANDKAAEYAAAFQPAAGYRDVVVLDNILWTAPAVVDEAVQQIIATANSAEFASKFANGGTVTAVCPVCGGEAVEWKPIGAGSEEEPKTTQTKITNHVYYDQDTWTTSQNILTGDTATGCVYLNGKTVTGTGRIRANKAINIMGPGKIIKTAADTYAGEANSMFYLDSANTKLAIYGGEFVNQREGLPLFAMTAANSKGYAKIYAGTFESTTGVALLANNELARFEVYGGLIKAGDLQVTAGSLTIGSATVAGNVTVAEGAAVTLTGTPLVLGTMDLTSGVKATVTDLTEGTSVTVKANGAFTAENEKAADYAAYFTAAEGYTAVEARENVLWTEIVVVQANQQAETATVAVKE